MKLINPGKSNRYLPHARVYSAIRNGSISNYSVQSALMLIRYSRIEKKAFMVNASILSSLHDLKQLDKP